MRLSEASTWPALQLKVFPPSLSGADVDGIGEEAIALAWRFVEATMHYRFPISRETTFEKFRALVNQWKEDTQFVSSTTGMILHPAYQEIIGMGPEIIPLILKELENKPDHWFAALRALTGVDPVAPAQRGRVKAMANAWLNWGRDHGYQW